MAFNLSSFIPTFAAPPSLLQSSRNRSHALTTKCETDSSEKKKLEIGSPIIVIEAPKMLKTAASMPCLRANAGLVKPGDVGRYAVVFNFYYMA